VTGYAHIVQVLIRLESGKYAAVSSRSSSDSARSAPSGHVNGRSDPRRTSHQLSNSDSLATPASRAASSNGLVALARLPAARATAVCARSRARTPTKAQTMTRSTSRPAEGYRAEPTNPPNAPPPEAIPFNVPGFSGPLEQTGWPALEISAAPRRTGRHLFHVTAGRRACIRNTRYGQYVWRAPAGRSGERYGMPGSGPSRPSQHRICCRAERSAHTAREIQPCTKERNGMFRRYAGRHVINRSLRTPSAQARIGIASCTLAGLGVVGLTFANTASASIRLGGVDMQRACSVQWANFGPTTAVVRDQHNAYSWACRSNYTA
jgi:hypothetical protein